MSDHLVATPPGSYNSAVRTTIIIFAIALLATVVVWHLPGHVPSLLGIFSLWILLPSWLLFVAALVMQDRLLIGLTLPLILLHLVRIVPDLAPAQPIPEGPQLHIVSANLLMVHPDPLPLAEALLARDADILLLQEVSDIWMEALRTSGVLAAYPHQALIAQNDSFGTALLSRVPLQNARVEDLLGVPYTRATVMLGDVPVNVLNIHTLPPRNQAYFERWKAQMAFLGERSTDRPLAIIGDLNTTQFGREYRDLQDAGMQSAHRLCGRGHAISFPNGLFPLPPVRLDHALLSEELTCVSITEIHQTGSDHSALDMVIGLTP